MDQATTTWLNYVLLERESKIDQVHHSQARNVHFNYNAKMETMGLTIAIGLGRKEDQEMQKS